MRPSAPLKFLVPASLAQLSLCFGAAAVAQQSADPTPDASTDGPETSAERRQRSNLPQVTDFLQLRDLYFLHSAGTDAGTEAVFWMI
jgi:hypothetical protein